MSSHTHPACSAEAIDKEEVTILENPNEENGQWILKSLSGNATSVNGKVLGQLKEHIVEHKDKILCLGPNPQHIHIYFRRQGVPPVEKDNEEEVKREPEEEVTSLSPADKSSLLALLSWFDWKNEY